MSDPFAPPSTPGPYPTQEPLPPEQPPGSPNPPAPSGPSVPSGPFGPSGPSGPTVPTGPSGPSAPFGPSGPTHHAGLVPAPTLFNGATVHGLGGTSRLRHRAEMPLVWLSVALTVLAYGVWFLLATWLAALTLSGQDPASLDPSSAELYDLITGSTGAQLMMLLPLLPVIVWIARAMTYARLRASGVQMSPTQFPEGYRMVVEAAAAFGLRRVPDAYVVLGNGQVNAFAAGHGLRRFVVVYSDLFEVGGAARDPEALRFVIAHEVGHLAAGHVGYVRLLFTQLAAQVPVLGPALSRAQEYTADNHGYALAPGGVPGVMGLLSAGKYLGAHVNLHALADRATREYGVWLHLAVWGASHPPSTWRAHALRDRSRPGRIMLRPAESTAWYPPIQPSAGAATASWPTPPQALALLDAAAPVAGGEEQFGRYPGLSYGQPRDAVRLADPRPLLAQPRE